MADLGHVWWTLFGRGGGGVRPSFLHYLEEGQFQGLKFYSRSGHWFLAREAKPKKIYAFDGSMRRFRYENKNIPHEHGHWLMHEFNLEGSTLPSSSSNPLPCDLVLCRVRKNKKIEKRQKFSDQQINNITESSSLVPSTFSMQDEAGEVVVAEEIVSGGNELSSDNTWAQSFAQDFVK